MAKCVTAHKQLWHEVVMTADYLRNRMYRTFGNMSGKTPYEAFTGNNPDLSGIHALAANPTCIY